MGKKQAGTETSSFGNKGKINHDSSPFYSSKLYADTNYGKTIAYEENQIDQHNLNKIFCKSSISMDEIPNNSVHLIVTSPPYNSKKEYDEDLTLDEYLSMLMGVFSESYRVLVTGGRLCVNIANLGRKPYIPLHSYLIQNLQSLGFLMRGEIIWDKGASAGHSTAWGSWKSASNPVLRDTHEYIIVFSKDSFSRKRGNKVNTITKEQFIEWTKSVWSFNSVSAKKIGHPAPFPIELPYRLIQLYSFLDDVVLDPFVGSGSTCVAALKSGRKYIGYDISEKYVKLAIDRLNSI